MTCALKSDGADKTSLKASKPRERKEARTSGLESSTVLREEEPPETMLISRISEKSSPSSDIKYLLYKNLIRVLLYENKLRTFLA